MTADPGFPAMNPRKHEVIEIITKYLENAVVNARIVTSYIPGLAAEECYDRIAPLMREEFSTSDNLDILGDFFGNRITIASTIDRLKRLWEGKNKPKADGMGECKHEELFLFSGNRLPMCANCQQKVDRRSGEGG